MLSADRGSGRLGREGERVRWRVTDKSDQAKQETEAKKRSIEQDSIEV